MKKEDLKTGMVVMYRDGEKAIVFKNSVFKGRNILAGNCMWTEFEDFNNDLTCKNDKGCDIFKVFKPQGRAFLGVLEDKYLELIWEREPEIKELTMQQIADKFDIPVDQLRIKE